MANRFQNPVPQAINNAGNSSLPGAKWFFYRTGTTDPKDTYADSDLTVVNPNPLIADANGRMPNCFLATDEDYNVVHTDSDDVEIWQRDPVNPATTVTATSILAADGSALNPSYSFVSDPDCGMFRVDTNKIGISTNGITALTVDGSQRVLIGTEDSIATVFGVQPNFQIVGS